MKSPIVSIVIPTYYASEDIIEVILRSIAEQRCDKEDYEIIIADNQGTDVVKQITKKYAARFIEISGNPPQVCQQRNSGAKVAKGQYIFFLDHDVELSKNLIKDFLELVKNKQNIDAWYVPYKIIGKGKLLTKIRNFEEDFYRNSVIAAARIIKKEVFWRTEVQFDPKLNAGPADWDFNIQLQLIGAKFDYIKDYVYHHEESLNFWSFTNKKTIYIKGGEIYKDKWKRKNPKIYNDIVKKQYDPFYRLFWIFVEKEKWRKLLSKLPLYLLFLLVKVSMAANYLYSLKRPR